MSDERSQVAGRELARWLILAAVLVLGLVLYFREGRSTRPVVHPGGQESAS